VNSVTVTRTKKKTDASYGRSTNTASHPPSRQGFKMNGFKLPQSIPQDLLLICDLISDPLPHSPRHFTVIQTDDSKTDDSIDSSDSEIASEDEIEAVLIPLNDEDELQGSKAMHVPLSSPFYSAHRFNSEMASDSSSDSDSDSSMHDDDDTKSVSNHGLDEDDEPGPAPTTGTYFQTKNETNDTDIIIPDIVEVDPEEVLEKVGEIMSIMEKVVIVKGVPSERTNQGSERALDSDTLLVFEDRKVMGYVSIVKSSCRTFLRRIYRSMKHLVQLPSPCIKSSSVIVTPSILKRCNYLGMFSMYRKEVALSSSIKSSK
jgi:hypothetical protein